ncbi:MAG: hypothetical protein JXQ73_22185 [Phycisphaerae bacterium]|nr:hypothetical protein [Phycisphaerae bacterium]
MYLPLLLSTLTALALAPTDLELECAFWRPDAAQPVAWKEGNPDLAAKTGAGYPLAGSLHVLVHNIADAAVSMNDVLLDGETCNALREKRQVVWWRTQPNPIPPNGVAEVTVRLRNPLKDAPEIRLLPSRGNPVTTRVEIKPPDFRIETIGLAAQPDRLMIYLTQRPDASVKIKTVELDYVDVTRQSQILTSESHPGCCPIVVPLDKPWATGSFHAVKVIDAANRATAHVFRVPPPITPLGTYGHHDFETFAANDLNTYVCFGGLSRDDLDRLGDLHMRGAFHIGFNDPPADVRGHPAIAGYLQLDEPDCADHGAKDRPHAERIGHHAQQMVDHAERVCRLDPNTVLWQTLDLTYKPANWFHYGLVADVTNTDAYPLVVGEPLTFVRDVVRTARSGCSPRPLVFTFQSGWEEAENRGWNRPPFADEMRRMMLYALGCGARGLVSYIHCSEKVGTWIGHGTNEFPDLWYEQGRVYRSLALLDDLIRIAHPLTIESNRPDKLWIATLAAGPDAMLVIVVNDNYTSSRDVFDQTPARNVRLSLACPQWICPNRCVRIDDGHAQPVALRVTGGQVELQVGDVVAGALLLISQETTLPDRLTTEFERKQTRLGAALLKSRQQALAREARRADEMRTIPFRHRACKTDGRAIGGYGVSRPELWNPNREQHNTLEYWQAKGNDRMGVAWEFDVPPDRAGKPHTFIWMGRIWGTGQATGHMTLRAADGKQLAATPVAPGLVQIHRWNIVPSAPGKHTIELIQDHNGEKGGQIAKAAYVAPAK